MTDPIIKRGTVRSVIGTEVDTMDLTMQVNSEVEVANIPLAQFARQGGFDGARVTLTRAYARAFGQTFCGSLNLFSGRVSELSLTGTEVRMSVKSDLELLNVQMPRNVYQAGCGRTLYDAGCGLSAAAFTVTGNTTSGSTATSINCNLGQTAGYFNLGVVKFTTGDNAGVTRSIRVHTTGVLELTPPLQYTPAAGDLFTARPGCDKRQATCNATFNNSANFRGFPFIPVPESTM